MSYSVQNLTLVADCNIVLAMAAKEKAILNFKKLSDEFSSSRFLETAQEIQADLDAVNLELAAVEGVLAGLAPGPVREEYLDKQRRLDYRRYVLQTRKESHGIVALLGKEMDLQRIVQELEEVEAFIQAVETRRGTLQG